MKPRFLVFALIAVLSATVAGAQRPQVGTGLAPFVSVNAPVVAITHVRVVDGTGAAARDDQTIIVREDRIVAVGPAASTSVPAGAQVLNLTGHTVIPGLVGLHEHTWFGGIKKSSPMGATAPV